MTARSVAAYSMLLLALCFAAARPSAAAQGVPIPGWETIGQPGGWQLTDSSAVHLVRAEGETPYVEVISKSVDSSTYAQWPIPLDGLKGSVIQVSVDVRVKNVSKPPASYLGVKAMVHVAALSDTWDQADANGDGNFPISYDWTRLTFRTGIPANAASATLCLGLQSATGCADFRNVSIAVVQAAIDATGWSRSGPIYTGHAPGALRGVMIDTATIGAGDVETLKQWNVNLVRWQMVWWNHEHAKGPGAYDEWFHANLRHLDEMLPLFRKAGILVVLDLHSPPSDVFTSAAGQQHFLDCWKEMATRYRDQKQIWAYDLMNEPHDDGVPSALLDWHALAEKTARMVRGIDSLHAIIVEPRGGDVSALPLFRPLGVPGVVYSVHMYTPSSYTLQGLGQAAPGRDAITYPGEIQGVQWNKDRIRQCLQQDADYARAFHVHIFVGEFSAIRWAPGADRYLSDVIDILEENHWDWTYHAFREWDGWSAEVGEDPADHGVSTAPTARLRVLQRAYAKNLPVRP